MKEILRLASPEELGKAVLISGKGRLSNKLLLQGFKGIINEEILL